MCVIRIREAGTRHSAIRTPETKDRMVMSIPYLMFILKLIIFVIFYYIFILFLVRYRLIFNDWSLLQDLVQADLHDYCGCGNQESIALLVPLTGYGTKFFRKS